MPGGVCAVLDYDVEMMAEYVAEMANRLAMGTPKTPETFRKFITQILSSTRLPRTTILLGMNYFAKRINMMNIINCNKVTLSEGHIWRLLTVALLLGSKFLDDNTFQNRSWADVSGIPVRELNKLEREWMESIQWRMFVNLDLSEDYQAWINSWSEWESNKKQMQQQAQLTRERMASLSLPADAEYPNATRNPMAYAAWCKEQIAEYNRLTSRAKPADVSAQAYRGHEQPQQHQPQPAWSAYSTPSTWGPTHGAPVTPPDSGYGTPEYNMTATAMSSQLTSPDWYHQGQQPHLASNHGFSSGAYAPYHNNHKSYSSRYSFQNNKLPTYFYGQGHSIWENRSDRNNGMNCYQNASHGHAGQNFYGHGMSSSYGQPVMG